jgi:hypothetical protein
VRKYHPLKLSPILMTPCRTRNPTGHTEYSKLSVPLLRKRRPFTSAAQFSFYLPALVALRVSGRETWIHKSLRPGPEE